MKPILNLCCAASSAWVVSIAAGNWDLPLHVPVAAKATPGVSRHTSFKATLFGSHVRSKVIQYFDTYRTDPLGLPPGYAAGVGLTEVPASWTHQGLTCGKVVDESDRSALLETPADLLRILPARQPAVRYYLAGSHLVALDPGYKIVDSILIPTLRLPCSESAESPGAVQLVRHFRSR